MLRLANHSCSLANVNVRIERHGDERKLACDAKIVAHVSNEKLDEIEPGLCESLYRRPRAGEQQPLLDGPLTAVKFPAMKPLQLTHRFTGYEITVAPLQAEEGEGLFLADVELKGFAIEPHEGGSATLTFTASSEVSTKDATELLDALIREDAQITLTPPTAPAAANDEGGDDESLDQAA